MKKIICIVLTAIFVLSFAACSKADKSTTERVSQTGKAVNDLLNSIDAKSTTTLSSQTTTMAVPSVSDPAFKPKDGGVSYNKADIDLTKMSSTMVYSQVNDMVTSPENYLGKTVRMNGTFVALEETQRNYYACIIADATACCSQGIEFMLNNDYLRYPDEYPKTETNITVSGVFDVYNEGENRYVQLINAVIE
ncbi:MAG: hypothetical protein IJU45_00465 [Clostridia bacterium]|nr:hypothetical protein [Clostridia bacterium]